ncbi:MULTISPECIES: EAL domain-containing protein [unclassified Acinetobacter]|uniref:EAL domain-containing protein n=1 Tax=unclassified Acinetobacter TaxID=196816 RepID=UPI0035B94D25
MKLAHADKKPISYVIRFLMVDHQQSTFNQITDELQKQNHKAMGKLLDDFASFDKMLNLQWDVIVFSNAYDFDHQKALSTLNEKGKKIPVIVLTDKQPDSDDSAKLFKSGAYDVVNPAHIHHLSLTVLRATALSRLMKREHQLSVEIDQLQQQTQTLVETTEYAVAIFQEGIHISSNDHYAHFFGLNAKDLVGMPIMDVLQPENPQQFKQFLKQLTKNNFVDSKLEISSANPLAHQKQFEISFSPTEYDEDPALQLVIATSGANSATSSKAHEFADAQKIHDHLTFSFAQSNKVGVVLYHLYELPTAALEQGWKSSRDYFAEVSKKLAGLVADDLIRVSETVFLTTQAVHNEQDFNLKLKSIYAQLPKNIHLANESFPVGLKLSSLLLNHLPDVERMPVALARAFANQFNPNQSHAVAAPQTHTAKDFAFENTVKQDLQHTPVTQATFDSQPLSLDNSGIDLLDLDTDLKATSPAPTVEKQAAPELDFVLDDMNLSLEPTPEASIVSSSGGLSFDMSSNNPASTHIELEPTLSLDTEHSLNFEPSIAPTQSNNDLQFSLEDTQQQVAPTLQFEAPIVAEPVVEEVAVVEAPVATETIPAVSLGEQIETPQDASFANSMALQATEYALMQQIDDNSIQLSFQQLYDKEDIDTHMYEITASFKDENGQMVALEDLESLNHNSALALKLDRWLLVEASKRLHQYLVQSPKARIVVNVHQGSLHDASLIALLSKLVNLINSKYTRPLILQLREQDMTKDLDLSKRFGKALLDNNIGLSVKDFGGSVYSVQLLQDVPMKFARLSSEFTEQLKDDEKLVDLQEKLDAFKELNAETQFLIQDLNDMSAFANAWNVDVRYLQGDYFQARQANFLDSTG